MTTSSMDANLETAAKEGDVAYLDRFHVKNRETENGETTSESSFLGQTPEGDNILHLAAKRNRYSFIEKALQKIPAVVLLICRSNSRGENPLHIAAQLGHLDIVQVLVDSYKTHLRDVKDMKFRSTLLSLMVVEEGTSPDPWIAQDSSGNTPLHEALRSGYEEVAMYLLQVEPKLADSVNNAAEGILFLAAAYGHEQVLEMILTSEVPYSLSSPAGLTPLHALIHNCSEGAAQILLRKHPELAKRADKHKQTAIYYAAVANKDRHVEVILKTDKSCAYLKDENGFTPLLIAASLGQLKAVHTILLHCPESITICDTNSMTALHLMKLESYEEGIEVLMNPAMRRLINEPDLEGNSPLHLAVKNSDHVKAKVILDMDKTGINLRNKNGDTPWDLTKQQKELSEDMVKIGYDLIMHSSDKHKPTHQETENQPPMIHQTVHSFQEANKIMHNNFSMVALIAAILAAVTFAAGFLVPGGFDINGHAVLTRVTAFKVFILSNTTAMCGYTFVLFSALSTMMLGQRDDKPRYLLSFSIHILQLSFYATLIAFVSIMYALTSANSLWLAIVLVCLPPCAVFLTFSKSLIFRLVRFFSKLWM